MDPARDRKTWISTLPAVAPRLEVRQDPSVRTILDGAWWPRSRATVTELTNLIIALDGRQVPVTRIMLNTSAWDEHPRRISVAGRTVRLGWFHTLDANLLIATTGTDQRVDLLVIAPDTSTARAAAAATMATDGEPTLRPAAILAALLTQVPRQPRSRPPAEDVWESEGGRINGHQSTRSIMPETGPVN
jgi:Family of unknown function (DUF5994)